MNEIERAIEYLEPIAYCEHLKVAIEALREQAEREKGCFWCLDVSLNDVRINEVRVNINYCPMCGKRLEVEP